MFEKRLAGIARRYFGHVVEWEDALESGVEVAKEVAIMRWLKDDEHLESYATAGHVTIDNDYWNAYLDHDWKWEHAYRFQNRYPHRLSVGGRCACGRRRWTRVTSSAVCGPPESPLPRRTGATLLKK